MKSKNNRSCLGYKVWTDYGWEYDCGYNTFIYCEECKYYEEVLNLLMGGCKWNDCGCRNLDAIDEAKNDTR